MFTFKTTELQSTLIQLESKYNYDELLYYPIRQFKQLSDIWKPSHFCWSKNEVENSLHKSIDICDDLMNEIGKPYSAGDAHLNLTIIDNFKVHLNEILEKIQLFKDTDSFRY